MAGWITLEFDGMSMSPQGLSNYIFRTRGYRVDYKTICERHHQGKEGEMLVADVRRGGRWDKWFWPEGVVPALKGWGCR